MQAGCYIIINLESTLIVDLGSLLFVILSNNMSIKSHFLFGLDRHANIDMHVSCIMGQWQYWSIQLFLVDPCPEMTTQSPSNAT